MACRADVSTYFARMVRAPTPLDVPAFAAVLEALFAYFQPDLGLAVDDRPALWEWEHFGSVLAKKSFIHVAM